MLFFDRVRASKRFMSILFVLLLVGPIAPLFVTAQFPVVPPRAVYHVKVIASSSNAQFVGAAADASSLFVGLLNGTVLKMDATSGRVSGSASLPDGNSAAHLTYYDGSLYVGTEWLQGAKDKAPFHVYKIDPVTMNIVGQVRMNSRYANGLAMALNGFLWAADGHCTLYKIDPSSMAVVGTVPWAAEDELLFDGTNYWGECMNQVHVLKPGSPLPVEIASGSLVLPDRPRGFFATGGSVYSSGTTDSNLYSMSFSGGSVSLRKVGTIIDHGYLTRDTTFFGGLTYAYLTATKADLGQMSARVLVYASGMRLRAVVPLPGPALPSDASQHTLLVLDDEIYFITGTSIGYIDVSLTTDFPR